MKHDTSKREMMAKAQPITKKSNRKSTVAAVNRSENKTESSKINTKRVILAQKTEPQIKKIKSNKIVQAAAPKSKRAEIFAPVKPTESKIAASPKPKIQKLKLAAPSDKIKSAEKKVKPNKAVQTNAPKTKNKPAPTVAATQSKARKIESLTSTKQINPIEKKKISRGSLRRAAQPNSAAIKLRASEKLIKSKPQKMKADVSIEKIKIAGENGKQNVVARPAKSPNEIDKTVKPVRAVKSNVQKVQPVISTGKIVGENTKIKSPKNDKKTVVEQFAVKEKRVKPEKVKSAKSAITEAKTQSTEPVVRIKKLKAAENKIETTIQPPDRKLKKKKVKPLGAAVFRGRKDRYDFQVFPLDTDFEDVSAIYVISRRKIDREKKGHHVLVCIGQTDSVASEIKRHKNKCIKKHNANVISILPEADEKKRFKIEEDLRAAHAIACRIV